LVEEEVSLVPSCGSMICMARERPREKATVTIDREKLERARALIDSSTMSETIDVALDRLIRAEQLRHDVEAYGREPQTAEEIALAEVSPDFDLGDDDVDYDALYAEGR
jgi:post-segregation antitoxin (ccd killing protein)